MKSAWIGSGFSHQSVPSLSKTATRSAGGTVCAAARRTRPARRASVCRSRTRAAPAHAHAPAASAVSSFLTTWSIVKLAASCRGGNSLNVSRNWVDDRRRGQRDVVVVDEPVVVRVRGHVGTLERIGAQVEELRHAQRHERLRPDPQRPLRPLLHEDDLPVVEPEREHVAVVGVVDAFPAAGSCRPRRSGTAAGCSRRCAP